MAAQHDHFVGFVRAGNFGDGVVRGLAFGIDAIDDVEFERDISAVGEHARDAAIVFVAHHDSRYNFIDFERAIVESAYLPKFAAGVVDANQRAVGFQKNVELLVDLSIRERLGRARRRCRSW